MKADVQLSSSEAYPAPSAPSIVVALLGQFARRLAHESPDSNHNLQRQLVDGCIRDIAAKLSESTEQTRCIGLVADSEHILVRCPRSAMPNMNPAPAAPRRVYLHAYCSPQCYGFTKRRRKQGLGLRDSYVKGQHYSLRPCRDGWTVRDGLIDICGELYAPPKATSPHARCVAFKRQAQKRDFGLGDRWVPLKKTRVNTQYSPKPCTWWIVRDHVIAECRIEFTPKRATDKYCAEHSKASSHPSRRANRRFNLKSCYPHLKLGVSILRTCAYRKCGKTFDRAKRSTSGEYYCADTSHGTLEKLARKEDEWIAKIRDAQAETMRAQRPADWDDKKDLWHVVWTKLWSSPGKVRNPELKKYLVQVGHGCPSDKEIQRMRIWAQQELGPGGKPKI